MTEEQERLDYFAAAVLTGVFSNPNRVGHVDDFAKLSRRAAQAMLNELGYTSPCDEESRIFEPGAVDLSLGEIKRVIWKGQEEAVENETNIGGGGGVVTAPYGEDVIRNTLWLLGYDIGLDAFQCGGKGK